MTPYLQHQIAALGSELSPQLIEATYRLLTPLAARPDLAYGQICADLPYGTHQRHKLDLYGTQSSGSRPVVVYIHGGGFVAGDKHGNGGPFFANVGAWATANGMIAAIPNYRLAPEYPYPAGRDDVLAVVRWLCANVAQFGGNPKAIFLVGQSAGATHVADAVAELTRIGQSATIAGAVMLSGIYNPAACGRHPSLDAYYGTDLAARRAASSLPGLLDTPIPCLFALAEFDPPMFQGQAVELVAEYTAKHGRWPNLHRLPHHNHLSPALLLGAESEDDVGSILCEFILSDK